MMNKDEKETYLGGVESYEGPVPVWLIIVYALLLIWGAWYLVTFWGGFPPGP
jgi:hypothetical protein